MPTSIIIQYRVSGTCTVVPVACSTVVVLVEVEVEDEDYRLQLQLQLRLAGLHSCPAGCRVGVLKLKGSHANFGILVLAHLDK